MNKYLAFAIFLLISSFSVQSNDFTEGKNDNESLEFKIVLDKTLSPYFGSSLFRSLNHSFYYAFPYSNQVNGAIRIGRTLGDVFFNFHLALFNHEIMGHGWRNREFKVKNRHYHIRLFHGSAGGDMHLLSTQHQAIISAGGNEANFILSRQQNLDWLSSGKMSLNEAWLYIFSAGNQGYYVHFFRDTKHKGHDVQSYIDDMNSISIYGKKVIDIGKIRTLGLLDYADPFLYFSMYSIGKYLIDGHSQFNYPMIPLGNVGYLPGLRMILAPYGPEGQWVNYFKYQDMGAQVTLNYGKTDQQSSFGAGININMIPITDVFSIGGRLHFWNQPEIFTNNAITAPKKTGAMITVKAGAKLHKQWTVFSELGYKSKGYVPGEVIANQAIIRLGIFAFL